MDEWLKWMREEQVEEIENQWTNKIEGQLD